MGVQKKKNAWAIEALRMNRYQKLKRASKNPKGLDLDNDYKGT